MTKSKVCRRCRTEKCASEFYVQRAGKFGVGTVCKSCTKIQNAEYKLKHRERLKQYKAEYNKKNKNQTNAYAKAYRRKNAEAHRARQRAWYEKNREKFNLQQREWMKRRRLIDPVFKIKTSMRTRLGNIIRRRAYSKKQRLNQYLGCTPAELCSHLERGFQVGMTWENHGKWHVDHIVPLHTAKSVEDVYRLSHYTNLQPLWAKDNLAKNRKS